MRPSRKSSRERDRLGAVSRLAALRRVDEDHRERITAMPVGYFSAAVISPNSGCLPWQRNPSAILARSPRPWRRLEKGRPAWPGL